MYTTKLNVITDAYFGAVKKGLIEAGVPVFIFLSVDWSTTAKMLAPAVEALQAECVGKMLFFELNPEENPDAVNHLKAYDFPTSIVFKGGQEFARFVGAVKKEELKAAIDK
ncbi:thioredoxin family protein [Pseudomonas sp. NPDC090202]|uniref:thioredoxin family protein n=1 Tax=unclassified Pseudomonas TaxID=196821 RepID=UPI00381C24F5